jgi:hypothetical protein
MKSNEFYCVACRKKVTISSGNICVTKLKNDRYALKAYCGKCECNLTKFISNDSVPKMKSKFGKCSPKKSKKRSKSRRRRSKSRRLSH